MKRKNTIRLTESELKRVISESVKRVLNEVHIEYNEYGEPLYVEGDPEDYGDDFYDEEEEMYYRQSRAQKLAREIKDGQWDNEIFNEKWYNKYVDTLDINDGSFPRVDDAVKARRMALDKDYAWKQIGYQRKWDKDRADYEKDTYLVFGQGANSNIVDKAWRRQSWIDGTDNMANGDFRKLQSKRIAKQFPELFRKDGELRTPKQMDKGINNRSTYVGASKAADKTMLHRKGSANRDLMNMGKK